MLNKIKAVIFDVDGVLIDSVKANSIFFARIFKTLRIRYSAKEYIKRNHMPMWDIIKHFSGEKSDVKIRQMLQFAKKIPYPHKFVKVQKDSASTLNALSKKYQLAVVTARVKKSTSPVLKRYGFNKFIKTKVSFEDYSHPKPHPEPLLIALKKLRIKPHEAIYVGDMESDILCAKAAKVYSILYKNHYSKLNKAKPDYIVTSFKQLSELFNAR